jgi:GT2 family glycosyltransferase
MTPDVSVLIVNYNVKDYLLQCLRSVMASTGGVTYEIVVVDNASSDNSQAELTPLFPGVRWIQIAENIGFGRGNNVGLEHCTGRHVLFLNPDTLVANDTLSIMVRYLDQHPEVGLAGCKVLNPDGSFQLACRRGLPTPWASFCRLFGLQSLFPHSRLFAQYNLTYLPVDATYNVDALIGAFMMGALELVRGLGGFDPAFFMYGEDIDLCYRMQKSGKQVRYVHETSIVHYKGESTRRSSINEVRVFYEAMEIFARKHFGRSGLFLWLLRTGIGMRAVFERFWRRRRDLAILLIDVISVLGALLLATSIRFDGPFGFPAYAYPLVLVVVPLVVVVALVGVGEYVEYRPTVRRSFVGLLVSFFVLSSLTYFFKEFAFSRGVLLMTIGFTAAAMVVSRGLVALYDVARGRQRSHNILVVGQTEEARAIIRELQTAERRNATLLGVVSVQPFTDATFAGLPVVGTVAMLDKIVADVGADEVILADAQVSQADAMELMQRCAPSRARFHMAANYGSIVTARIINDVAGIEPTVAPAPLRTFRNSVLKRTADIVVATLVVPFVLMRLSLGRPGARDRWKAWTSVLRGSGSVVGLFPDGKRRSAGKPGITSLVRLSGPDMLDRHAIEQLNDYYVDHFSLSLDVDILLKHLFRRQRGKHDT